MVKEIIKLPEMKAVYCRCRDLDVMGTVSMWEKIISGKDCWCMLKPLRGKVRSFKAKDVTVSEVGETWDAYIPPEILFGEDR